MRLETVYTPLRCRGPQVPVGKKWQDLLKVITISCIMYISGIARGLHPLAGDGRGLSSVCFH
jgi:hypothetical protein